MGVDPMQHMGTLMKALPYLMKAPAFLTGMLLTFFGILIVFGRGSIAAWSDSAASDLAAILVARVIVQHAAAAKARVVAYRQQRSWQRQDIAAEIKVGRSVGLD